MASNIKHGYHAPETKKRGNVKMGPWQMIVGLAPMAIYGRHICLLSVRGRNIFLHHVICVQTVVYHVETCVEGAEGIVEGVVHNT